MAAHLGVSLYTVRVWAKTEKIPGVRIGRDWKFKISVVDEHLSRPRDGWARSDQSRAKVAYYKRKRREQER